MEFTHWKNRQLEDLPNEIWKPVKEYDGTLASNLGRIKTLECYVNVCRGGKRLLKGEIKLQVKGKDGYLRTEAIFNGRCKKETSHKICALAWKENPENKRTVQHENHVRHCNEEWNLNWATYVEQNQDSFSRKFNLGRVKSVNQYSKHGIFIKTWISVTEAKRCLSIYNIGDCANDKINIAGGFIWRWKAT